ncbi:hypothetical protein BDN67DRAFT_984666 [Paxillus ammoniavirescens]|nr:hypothetical protein BDN67DRAFT_984666 [Paxillus ammoniavirescens]
MDRDSDMPDANQPPPPPNWCGRREPSQDHDGCGRRRSPSADHGSRGQKRPRSEESDHNRRRCCGWIFEPQTGVIAHLGDCTHCEAYCHHYMDAAFSVDAMMCEATSQRKSYWEDLVLSRRGECHLSGLKQRVDELKGQAGGSTATSGPMMMVPSSCPKPTKITQRYTAEWSEDEPMSEDADNDWSPPTQMRSVGDSVILTMNKQQFVLSGEAAKNARSAYQKGHLPPISQGIKHFGDLATPLTTNDVDRLFAHAREGRGKAISQVKQYGHMLTTASERGMPLSDAQLYGRACWRGLGVHNALARPSTRPGQVSGAPNPSLMARSSAPGHTGPSSGTRAPRIAQPTYNDHPSAWTEWLRAYDHHCMGVLVNNNGTRSLRSMRGSMWWQLEHQTALHATRFNISISLMHVLGPMQNFGPNSGMIDIARALVYRGVPWGEVDDACLYGRTLARHLLTGDAPLSDTICQALQGYELCISSADLAAWYGENLPSGMAPAPALVGPALIEAFAAPSRTVVPPSPQDQDQDMGGPTAPSETGATHLSSSDTTVVGHVAAEPMEVESPLSLLSSEPELAQEGAGVRAIQGPLP